MKILTVVFSFLLLLGSTAWADTHYVDINSTNPVSPYISWETAANSIQDAVNAASNGDKVQVADGTYVITSQITIGKSINLSSVNGPYFTIIDAGSNSRVLYLNHPSCKVIGFSVINGYTSNGNGGGIYCSYSSTTVSHCIVKNNEARYGGWGWGGLGGGMYQGTAVNCIFSGNKASGSLLTGGGLGGAMRDGDAYNCTFTGNDADVAGGGVSSVSAYNCIIYYNSPDNWPDPADSLGWLYAYNCCTLPTSYLDPSNISGEPMFLDRDLANYRLAPDSPCINTGNNDYGEIAIDLDGKPRFMDGTVDIGAYEFGVGGCIIIHCELVASGFKIEWSPVFGYHTRVKYSTNLSTPFTDLSAPMPHPLNCYTDTVHAAESQCFYKVEMQP